MMLQRFGDQAGGTDSWDRQRGRGSGAKGRSNKNAL